MSEVVSDWLIAGRCLNDCCDVSSLQPENSVSLYLSIHSHLARYLLSSPTCSVDWKSFYETPSHTTLLSPIGPVDWMPKSFGLAEVDSLNFRLSCDITVSTRTEQTAHPILYNSRCRLQGAMPQEHRSVCSNMGERAQALLSLLGG